MSPHISMPGGSRWEPGMMLVDRMVLHLVAVLDFFLGHQALKEADRVEMLVRLKGEIEARVEARK